MVAVSEAWHLVQVSVTVTFDVAVTAHHRHEKYLFLISASWNLQWYGSGRFRERGRRSFTITWCGRIHFSFIWCLSASFRDCCRRNKSVGCSGSRNGTVLYFVEIWMGAWITTCFISLAHFLPQQHALHSVCPGTFGQWCLKGSNIVSFRVYQTDCGKPKMS